MLVSLVYDTEMALLGLHVQGAGVRASSCGEDHVPRACDMKMRGGTCDSKHADAVVICLAEKTGLEFHARKLGI